MIDQSKIKPGDSIIFYDGVCGLCDRFVQFVLKHAQSSKFLFCSLQSQLAADLLGQYGENSSELETVFVLTNYGMPGSELLKKAKAVIFVLDQCNVAPLSIWQFFKLCRFLPNFILNKGYDLIAAIRYKIFGQYDSCLASSPEWRDKFIDP